MGIAGLRESQQPLQVDLPRRVVQKIGTADDVSDALRAVIDATAST